MNRIVQTSDCRGSALVCAAFVLMLVSLAATTMTVMVQQSAFMNSRLIQRAKALEVAEAGANELLALLYLQPKTAYYNTGKITKTVGEGSVTVFVSHVQDEQFCVSSTGAVDGVSQTVKVYTQVPSFSLAMDKGIFSNANIDGNGNGRLTNGSHSNLETDYWGNCEVTGWVDASLAAEIGGNASVDGGIRSHLPRLKFPSLNLDHYYEIAQRNNQIIIGDQDLKGDYNPPGGVLWIVGDVRIEATTTINGALFATGDIRQAGKCVQHKVGELPALVSRDGNIWLGGNGTFNGLIYAHSGRVELTGTTDHTGIIVAWGDVRTRGNWGVIQYWKQDPELLDDHRLDILAWEH